MVFHFFGSLKLKIVLVGTISLFLLFIFIHLITLFLPNLLPFVCFFSFFHWLTSSDRSNWCNLILLLIFVVYVFNRLFFNFFLTSVRWFCMMLIPALGHFFVPVWAGNGYVLMELNDFCDCCHIQILWTYFMLGHVCFKLLLELHLWFFGLPSYD